MTSFSYDYDANKNKTEETITGTMSNYGFSTGGSGYDDVDRLINWERDDTNLDQSWSLSNEGNWNSITENAVTQNRSHNDSHELTVVGGVSQTFDSKGNLTTHSNTQTYQWDFDNQLKQAAVPSGGPGVVGTHTYTYDALGRRVSKSVGGGSPQTIVFVCDVSQVISEYLANAADSDPERKYVYASYIDEPTLFIDSSGMSEVTYYYHQNNLYSVAALTNTSGTVVEYYAYDSYGNIQYFDSSGTLLTTQASTVGNPFTFTGRRRDDETHNYFYRARYYDAKLGRFLNRDPFEYIDSPNLYAYVVSSPLVFRDPFGLQISIDPIAGGGRLSAGKYGYGITETLANLRKLCPDFDLFVAVYPDHKGNYPVLSRKSTNIPKATIGPNAHVGCCCIRQLLSDPSDWVIHRLFVTPRWEARQFRLQEQLGATHRRSNAEVGLRELGQSFLRPRLGLSDRRLVGVMFTLPQVTIQFELGLRTKQVRLNQFQMLLFLVTNSAVMVWH